MRQVPTSVRIRNVERADWLRAPKQNPILYDRAFRLKREAEITDEMHEADDRLLRCIENGWELSLWDEIAAAAKVLPPRQGAVLLGAGHG